MTDRASDFRASDTSGGAGGLRGPGAAALERVRESLSSLRPADRFLVLSEVFRSLSESAGVDAAAGQQVESLTRRVHQLQQENATLSDELSTTRADLAHRSTQAASEASRAVELQKAVEEQRRRLKELQTQHSDLETQLVARHGELHNARAEVDRLTLRSQRAEMAAGDLSRVIELEESKMELASQIESIKREMERLREDKNREIEDLRKALDAAERATMQGADALLSKLWQRLAQLKPALVEGHVTPDVLTAERVFDAVFFLTEFSNAIDEEVRVFLSKYTNHESPLREPWNAYAARGTVRESVQKALAPGSGAIDPLRVRLNLLHLWVSAVTAANDSAIESIGSELKDQLLGAEVVGADQNVTVKNYYRQGLHNTFMDSMRRYRNKKMADIYAVGKDRGANS